MFLSVLLASCNKVFFLILMGYCIDKDDKYRQHVEDR